MEWWREGGGASWRSGVEVGRLSIAGVEETRRSCEEDEEGGGVWLEVSGVRWKKSEFLIVTGMWEILVGRMELGVGWRIFLAVVVESEEWVTKKGRAGEFFV